MSEEKRARLMAAATVTTILLIVILATVVIYQLVYISVIKNHRRQLIDEINYYTEQAENLENDLETRLKAQWYLEQKLLEYGYHY